MRGFVLLGASLAIALAASPAVAATQTATGSAVILRPLSLVNTATLSFGNIIPGASAGTVTIDAYTGARTMTGGVTLAGGTVSTGNFSGLSSAPSHLKIDLPNGSITLTRVGGGASMTANNFELNGDKNDWIGANEAFDLQVGARLNVGANQMTGTYVGTYDVTVTYR